MISLRHRGPDDSGLTAGPHAVLAHTRLAIIDIGGGQQPLVSADGRYRLVYNGELYNYRSLRCDLQRAFGWEFMTASDSEVMLAGLVSEGVGFLKRTNGMFAFALEDTQSSSLLLARDRFGKKPLFVRKRSDACMFASELSSLPGGVPGDASDEAILLYLLYGHIPAPLTVYPGIVSIEPGSYLRAQLAGSRIEYAYGRWWHPQRPLASGDAAWDDLVERELAAAVEVRLAAADVEVGCFLSGGVDSSLVAALAVARGSAVHTFSVGFSVPGFDESAYAVRVAQYLGTQHHAVELDPRAVPGIARHLVHLHGQPFADSSMIPTYAVSARAAEQVKVVLSGDGADELFGGYGRYVSLSRIAALERATRLPLGRLAGVVLRRCLRPQQYAALAHAGWRRHAAMSEFIPRQLLGRNGIPDELWQRIAPIEEEMYGARSLPWDDDYVEAAQWCDAYQTYLPNDILPKVDRSSMAVSLEVRCPFLDPRVADVALALPRSERVDKHGGKPLLKRLAASRVPRDVVYREKQGFSIPIASWLAGPLANEVEHDVAASSAVASFFSAQQLRAVLDRARRHDVEATIVWTLWMLALWEEMTS